jgi:hypothetical protein
MIYNALNHQLEGRKKHSYQNDLLNIFKYSYLFKIKIKIYNKVAEFTYTIYSVPDNMYGVYDHDSKVLIDINCIIYLFLLWCFQNNPLIF